MVRFLPLVLFISTALSSCEMVYIAAKVLAVSNVVFCGCRCLRHHGFLVNIPCVAPLLWCGYKPCLLVGTGLSRRCAFVALCFLEVRPNKRAWSLLVLAPIPLVVAVIREVAEFPVGRQRL